MIIWAAGVVLAVIAAALGPGATAAAARATAGPFVTLAAIILASALAGRAGAFQALAGVLIPVRGPRVAAATGVLALTAVLSALVNLDVAVVVAMPVALRAAARRGLPADRLAVAVAVVANAASFLLPTSNVTNLLLLGRVPLSTPAYLQDSWLPWILVTAITVGPLAMWAAHAGPAPARAVTAAREDPSARSRAPAREGSSARAVLDLVPMFLIASAIRALLGPGLALHDGFTGQLAGGTMLACAAGNLPAAAAMVPAGPEGLWAAILAATIGPNLLVTGSVATLIARRIARDGGAGLGAGRFSAVGAVLVPAQLAAAVLGLHVTGALR
ncbi:MAG TPA: SLC13 family permease [Streptosporangiaceae bacterium]|nr:SLC13 family permease [Streptosporangiaceae bacterium]